MDNYEAVKVEIKNIKEDIKEIREENKENIAYFRQVIVELKENGVRQTEILNQQKDQFTRVNNEIAELNVKLDSTIESQTINTNKLFKGVLKEVGVGIAAFILAYLLFKFGISGGINH